MFSRRVLAVAVLAAISAAVSPVRAQDTQEPPRPADDRWSFSAVVENDSFTGTDRHYSNGLHFNLLSPENELPEHGQWLARNLPMLAREGRKRIGYAIGQAMFTPGNIARPDLIRDDRPYAGWLYGEVAILSETDERLDTVALSLGVVGPLSGAEWTQRTWHRWIGAGDPKGWDHQIDNEPTLNLMIDRQWRYLWRLRAGGFSTDLTPHVGGALGNAFTHASVGATLRFGRYLGYEFGGPPRIRPSLTGAAHFTPPKEFGWYLFAGAEGRAVARNIFLDGNTFSDSHSVDKRPLVADVQLGIALTFPRFRVTYTYVHRTKEFYGQDADDKFAALTVTARF